MLRNSWVAEQIAACSLQRKTQLHAASRKQMDINLNKLFLYIKNTVAFSPQANYTDRATAACRRS
jgi:hypothetical protein